MNLDSILNALPMDQIANQLGVDPNTARSATAAALPALLGGLVANAQDPGGADSLTNALQQHDNDLADSVVNGQTPVDQINTTDGQNIVSHVFGNNENQVVNSLAGATGASSSLIAKVLPILAPIVMSYLAKRLASGGGLGAVLGDVLGGSQNQNAGAAMQGNGGGLVDILGQVLGGASSGNNSNAGGVDLAAILGGLLGAGRKS